jgi:hypothetical protein
MAVFTIPLERLKMHLSAGKRSRGKVVNIDDYRGIVFLPARKKAPISIKSANFYRDPLPAS